MIKKYISELSLNSHCEARSNPVKQIFQKDSNIIRNHLEELFNWIASCLAMTIGIKNILFLLIILLTITACGDTRYCIDADDFGFDKPTITANGLNVQGEMQNQYSQWIDSQQVVDVGTGDPPPPLYMIVRGGTGSSGAAIDTYSEWTSWFCENETTICSYVTSGTYYGTYDTCSNSVFSNWCPDPAEPAKYGIIYGTNTGSTTQGMAACTFRQGMGLYGLIVPTSASQLNPNASQSVILDPAGQGYYTFHLGECPTGDSNISTSSCPGGSSSGAGIPNFQNGDDTGLGGYYNDNIPSSLNGGRLYFKVLDNYYGDNAGQYNLIIKSGTSNPKPGPIQSVINFVTAMMDGIMKTMFINMVSNNDYIQALRACLMLYISMLGIFFVTGMIQTSQKEIMIRLFKLVLVIQLMTGEQSWYLFYDYFLSIFTTGLTDMINIVLAGSTQSTGGVISGFTFFDQMVSLFLGFETSAKIWSLIPANFGVAFFTIPVMYVGILFFMRAIAKAVIFYLVCYMAITLLIVIAPVFIAFLLFGFTRHLFEGWLKQLGNYFIQPVLVFAALGLVSQIIIDQLYRILGFKVCWDPIITFLGITILSFWVPHISISTDREGVIMVPGYYTAPPTGNMQDGTFQFGEFYYPYTFSQNRYWDLPFLDPSNSQDQILINNLSQGGNGWWTVFIETCVLGLLCFLLMKFNELVPGIAKGIAQVNSSFDPGKTSSEIFKSGATAIKSAPSAIYSAANIASKGKLDEGYKKFKHYADKATYAPRMLYGGAKKVFNAAQDTAAGVSGVIGSLTPQNAVSSAASMLVPKSMREGAAKFDERVQNFTDKHIGQRYDNLKEKMQQSKADALNKILPGFGDMAREDAKDPKNKQSRSIFGEKNLRGIRADENTRLIRKAAEEDVEKKLINAPQSKDTSIKSFKDIGKAAWNTSANFKNSMQAQGTGFYQSAKMSYEDKEKLIQTRMAEIKKNIDPTRKQVLKEISDKEIHDKINFKRDRATYLNEKAQNTPQSRLKERKEYLEDKKERSEEYLSRTKPIANIDKKLDMVNNRSIYNPMKHIDNIRNRKEKLEKQKEGLQTGEHIGLTRRIMEPIKNTSLKITNARLQHANVIQKEQESGLFRNPKDWVNIAHNELYKTRAGLAQNDAKSLSKNFNTHTKNAAENLKKNNYHLKSTESSEDL